MQDEYLQDILDLLILDQESNEAMDYPGVFLLTFREKLNGGKLSPDEVVMFVGQSENIEKTIENKIHLMAQINQYPKKYEMFMRGIKSDDRYNLKQELIKYIKPRFNVHESIKFTLER